MKRCPENRGPVDKQKPLYVLLAEEILASISSGKYPVGSLLPSEPQLCLRHKFSRHTVREAIRILQKMGVVSSHQGLGTRVESERVASRYVHSLNAIPDLWEYARNTNLKVIKTDLIDAGEVPADRAEVLISPKWCVVHALRYGKPGDHVAWTQLFFRSEFSQLMRLIGKRRAPLYALIAENYGVNATSVRQEISGEVVSAEIAAHMRIKLGTTCIVMKRSYFDADKRVYEITRSIYPATRFGYNVEFQLEFGNKA